MEEDVEWKNKKEFLNMPLGKIDKFNVQARAREMLNPGATGSASGADVKGKEFT